MRGTEFPVTTLLSVNISWEQTLGGQKKKSCSIRGRDTNREWERERGRERQGGYTQCVSCTQEEPSYDLMPPVNNLNK